MNTFSAGASIAYGWETFKKRPWFLIGATILFLVVVGAVSYILTLIGKGDLPVAIVMAIIRFFIEMLAVMGLLNFFIKAHDDVNSAMLADLWHPQDYWKFVGNIIMQVVLGVAGFIALVIPGVMISVAVKLSSFFVIDKHEGPIEALFSSIDATRNKKWAFFQFLVLQFVIIVAGLFVVGVGVFVAIPVVLLANVNAYRTLSRTA
jgi:uncharacterized membrane protein